MGGRTWHYPVYSILSPTDLDSAQRAIRRSQQLGVVGRGGLIAYMASKDVYRGADNRPADSEDVARNTTTVMAIWALADIVMLPRAFRSHESRSSTLDPGDARVRFASVPLRTRPGVNALAIQIRF